MQGNDYLLTVSARQKALCHGKEAGSFLLYGEEAYRILRYFFEITEIHGDHGSRFINQLSSRVNEHALSSWQWSYL